MGKGYKHVNKRRLKTPEEMEQAFQKAHFVIQTLLEGKSYKEVV